MTGWRCDSCGAFFINYGLKRVCLEDYYGVSDIFPGRNYGYIYCCPECGSEDYDEAEEEEEE